MSDDNDDDDDDDDEFDEDDVEDVLDEDDGDDVGGIYSTGGLLVDMLVFESVRAFLHTFVVAIAGGLDCSGRCKLKLFVEWLLGFNGEVVCWQLFAADGSPDDEAAAAAAAAAA